MIKKSIYRQDIQLLRGVSVLLVLLYHLDIKGFTNGFLGVDIFFVLSGFLMARLVNEVSIIEFYRKRLKRLIPAYLVTIFVTSLVVIFLAHPIEANQRIDKIFFDLLGLSNFVFWAENSYFSSSEFRPLLNLWSLGVELQFYIIAPFILPFLFKRKILLIVIIFGSLLASMILLTVSPKTSFFMLPTRLWEFLFGAYAAWSFTINNENKTHMFLRYFSIFCIISVIAFYPLPEDSLDIITGHPGLAAFFIVSATTCLLILKVDKVISTNSSVAKVITKIGDYSYSIYLTHFPIIVLVNYSPFGGTKLGFQNTLDFFLIVILTIVFSYLLFNYVERLRFKAKINIYVITVFTSCLFLGSFGTSLNSKKYSKEEILIYNAWKDRATYRCGKVNRIVNPLSKTCLLTQSISKKRVLLLGNSHADSLKTAFADVMKNARNSTYFYVANDPLMSENHNENIVEDEIKKNKINSVVVHYSSSFFNNKKNILRLISFIHLMKKLNVNILYIAPVPVYEVHVPKAMLNYTKNPAFDFPQTTISKYLLANSNFLKFVKENNIISKHIFYPHLLLCPIDKCIFAKDGVPYYFDSGHLTLTGAKNLKPMFKNLADKIAALSDLRESN